MNGFSALAGLKDKMMQPLYEKRRHFGCEVCGKTFYGHYRKTGLKQVPNGVERPSTRAGFVIVETYDNVFYPECPECMTDICVDDAKYAIARRNHRIERSRKNKEAAQKRKATIERKRNQYWERVRHVRENPEDITDEESKNYNFLCAMINIPKYGSDPDVIWRRGERNGHLTIKHHSHHQGQSRSGKTHYYYKWFDVLDHRTGKTYQVSHFIGSDGKAVLSGYNKNIFET